MSRPVPVSLVSARTVVPERPEDFSVRNRLTPQEALMPDAAALLDHCVLIDPEDISQVDCIYAGLRIRNAGRTVFVGGFENVPVDLVADIHEFMCEQTSRGVPLRTELLLMEDVIDIFGNIKEIVAKFEAEMKK